MNIFSVMQREAVNKYLLIFTFTVASIALLLLIFMFLKDKVCPRKSIYSKQSYLQTVPLQKNEVNEILHDSPDKVLLRSVFYLIKRIG